MIGHSLGFIRYGWVPERWAAAILRLHADISHCRRSSRRKVRPKAEDELPRPALSFCSFTTNSRIIKGATFNPTNADSVIK